MITIKDLILFNDCSQSFNKQEKIELNQDLGRFEDYHIVTNQRDMSETQKGNLILCSLIEKDVQNQSFGEISTHQENLDATEVFYGTSYFEDPVMTEETMTVKEALNLFNSLDNMYGMLLINRDGKVINPLHPITALTLLEYQQEAAKYKAAFFKLKDDKIESLRQELHRFNFEDISNRVVLNYMSRITSISKTSITTMSDDVARETACLPLSTVLFNNATINLDNELIQRTTGCLTIDTVLNKTVEQPVFDILIPVQIIDKQFAMPYYGITHVIAFDNPNKIQGRSITPMLSCNYNTKDINKYGSICCGKENSRYLEGLRVTNHANLNSPFFRKILCSGWYQWAEYCIELSKTFYRSAGWLPNE